MTSTIELLRELKNEDGTPRFPKLWKACETSDYYVEYSTRKHFDTCMCHGTGRVPVSEGLTDVLLEEALRIDRFKHMGWSGHCIPEGEKPYSVQWENIGNQLFVGNTLAEALAAALYKAITANV